MSVPHLFPVRVYYEDTDFSGFVYHAGYLRFFERGRSEYLRALGIVHSKLQRDEDGLVFVVSRMTIDYRKPALMDDTLTISTEIVAAKGAAMTMHQIARRDDTVLVEADVIVAAVRAGRAVRLPKRLIATLATTGIM